MLWPFPVCQQDRGVSSGGAYTPDEILNSIFLPLRKKALMGDIGCRRRRFLPLPCSFCLKSRKSNLFNNLRLRIRLKYALFLGLGDFPKNLLFLSIFFLSISLSLCLSLSLSLYISLTSLSLSRSLLSLPTSTSNFLSPFSLPFSLAYLMDFFVLVISYYTLFTIQSYLLNLT